MYISVFAQYSSYNYMGKCVASANISFTCLIILCHHSACREPARCFSTISNALLEPHFC